MKDIIGTNTTYIGVLDHGYVQLIDTMPRLVHDGQTADHEIVRCARVSNVGIKEGDYSDKAVRGLIRYLVRHKHTSPLEMVETKWIMAMPIFVARQFIRHRTACLAGDTELVFDLPNGGKRPKAYPLTIKQVYDRWQPSVNQIPSAQRNPHRKRDRVKAMLLRSVNEQTGEIYHTRITDIWKTGVKDIIKVKFFNGQVLRATKDHLCYTDKGWLRLGDALQSGARFCLTSKKRKTAPTPPKFNEDELSSEVWKPIVGFAGKYEVSSLGRIRSLLSTRNRPIMPTLKLQTVQPNGYVVSLSENSISKLYLVHRLVADAFLGSRSQSDVRHLDSNNLNNRVQNLAWGSPATNVEDRFLTGCDQSLCTVFESCLSWEYDGQEETYDLSVSGPYHNFSAGGVFVHNSVNEISSRYAKLPNRFYVPDVSEVRRQSNSNKQGSEGSVDPETASRFVSWLQDNKYDEYEAFTEEGVARELARINLPTSIYTEWVWKIDLHNLLHFLKLRCDKHAQAEIRAYADAMLALISPYVPFVIEAWNDFDDYRDAVLLTGPEVQALKTGKLDPRMTKRERDEWAAKKARLGL